jgi:hypothetical protein
LDEHVRRVCGVSYLMQRGVRVKADLLYDDIHSDEKKNAWGKGLSFEPFNSDHFLHDTGLTLFGITDLLDRVGRPVLVLLCCSSY